MIGRLKAHRRGALNGSLRGPPSKHLLTLKSKPFITLFLGPASTFAYLAFYICPFCKSSVPRSRLRFHGQVFVQDVCPIGRSFIYPLRGSAVPRSSFFTICHSLITKPNCLTFLYMAPGMALDHSGICRREVNVREVLRHG